jgi:Chaperone of endosialidase
MKNQKYFASGIFVAVMFVCLQTAVLGQTANDGTLANVTGGGSSIRWDVIVPNSGVSLTISAPDGRAFSREYRAGTSPEISLSDKQLEGLPDGTYSYELRLRPVLSPAAREALKAARGQDDDPEAERAGRKRPVVPVLVQSGSFSILNGAIIVAGAVEGRATAKITGPQRTPGVISGNTVTRLRNHRFSLGAMPDQVIADDLIVQGSACVGLDCVNNEAFGFDTIRLKENNDRIQFDDTSTSAGFPTNNWQIRANSSASGGASFLAFVDQGATGNSETGTILFEVDAGAPANSVKVSSTGKVGFRTGTPVLDLHITTSDTPAQRLEQTSAGGFTAQTWDIAGNEANFFVRDVTGGSRLPFRIRPGAPTSSIDINASGLVGIGTASPSNKLTVFGSSSDVDVKLQTTNTGTSTTDGFNFGVENATQDVFINQRENAAMRFFVNGAERITVKADGSVGIGTTTPDLKLSVNGDADKSLGGGSWQFFSDERLKNIKGRFNGGLKAVMQLQPIRYEYKRDNALGLKSEVEQVGFGAQALQKVIPEAVTRNANGYLMVNNDPILWTMLNAIKEQQKEIAELKGQIRKLQTTSRRRKK